MKDMVENTDFEDELNSTIKEAGLDRMPEFEFLKDKRTSASGRLKKGNARALKVAGFILAVFVVSSIMTIATNSDLALAGKFQFNNLIFSIKNGFLTSAFDLKETPVGRELLIENEEQISIGRGYLKELKIPGYIPDGYKFTQLQIKNNPKNEYFVMYTYINEPDEVITVMQERLADYNRENHIVGIEDEFYIDDTHIFYVPDFLSDNRSIYAFTEFEIIYVSGPLALADLIKIFETIK